MLSVITWTVAVLAVLLVCLIQYIWSYWARLGVKTAPFTIPYGNVKEVFERKKNISFVASDIYNKMKSHGFKYTGIYFFTRPMLVINDLELVKSVLQSDFEYFHDRGFYVNEKADPLSGNLVNLEGQRWKNIRSKLTPTFTSGKIKTMFESMLKCADELNDVINKQITANEEAIDIKDVLQRFTIDVIGTVAFGVDSNCLKNPNAEFAIYGKKIFEHTKTSSLIRLATLIYPKLTKLLSLRKHSKEVEDFFVELVKQTEEYRKKNKVERNDFMQLLLKLKQDDEKDGLNTLEMTAQSFVFFVGGFETSSSTMNFCLYELSKNQEIQNKLREEIRRVIAKNNGKITYEALTEMEYLEMTISETLRKYPVAGMLNRVAAKDYEVPNSDLIIKKGIGVIIPTYAIHHDPENFPNPELFDPERFSAENKKNIHQFAYLPFGAGPRICIGARFGNLQVKLGLASILKDFRVTLNKDKTKEPIEFHTAHIILQPTQTIWLNVEKV